ncbi:DUF5344 family protein [Virgibacillus sp. W0181]|uniref:DUF5344 family protein n=1 Tax=Virgibacillus sp. W0181 TaxID=3391581 RepID=UPI003F473E34
MSDAIKVVQSDTERALAELKASVQELNVNENVAVQDDNRLTMVNALNEMNETLARVLNTYQSLLTNNEEATRKAVDSLVQTDQNVASGIRLLK